MTSSTPRRSRSSRKQLFYAKVEIDVPTGCWRWLGGKHPGTGYATFFEGSRTMLAHRWSYRTFVGSLIPGMVIDHVWDRGCRYKDCVNPEHLEQVTVQVNASRGTGVYKTGKCVNGHAFEPGTRNCRTCNSERAVAWRKANPKRFKDIQDRHREKKRATMLLSNNAILQRQIEE